ncbi:MAG: HAD family hydrolase [Desulfovibrionales bacterium]
MTKLKAASFSQTWGCRALLLDLDGVITDTAHLHFRAWKTLFDEYLRKSAERDREVFQPFLKEDYLRYVDGKPRYDGVRDLLISRNIRIPYGHPSDSPERETVCGLGNRKNSYFNELLKKEGAEVLHPSVDWVRRQKQEGILVAVVSSSKNTPLVLKTAGLEDLFQIRVDGNVGADLGLEGKPAPDYFLEAASRLEVAPEEAAMVEDAVSGVDAGRRGGFKLVVGISRSEGEKTLLEHGAHVVVNNLAQLDEIDPHTLNEDKSKEKEHGLHGE